MALKTQSFWLFLFLIVGFSNTLKAQDYVLYPSYCVYQGANYHIAHPSDWNFYDCNPNYMVKWKYYDLNCELQSVTYGPDSPDCLCNGTLQVQIMNEECEAICEEITLPRCRKKGGISSLFRTGEPGVNDPQGGTPENCELPCDGDFSGEICEEIEVEIGYMSYCFNGGIIGTFVNSATGATIDCTDNAILRWRHLVPNPDYPSNSDDPFIVDAQGTGSDFGSCLCGGTLVAEVRNACCETFEFEFNTPECPNDGSGFRPGQPISGLNKGAVKLFPNPVSSGVLNLNLEETDEIDVQLQLFSQDGKLVKTIQTTGANTAIDVSNLNPGVYWINVRGSINFSEKVMIH